MSQAIHSEPTGGPLSTQEIINQLNNPYSRLRQDVGVYITSVYIHEQFEVQNNYQQMILAEREQLLSRRSGTSSEADDIDEQVIERLECIPAKNQELLQKLQVQSHELDSLYKEYDQINHNVIKIETEQREKYNTTLEKLGLDTKYQLTPEKQIKLHDSFKETEKRSEKLRDITGKVNTETEKDLSNELKFMRQITETSEQHNLKPSEIRALSKGRDPDSGKSLFQTVNEDEKAILGERKKLEALIPQIVTKENEVANTAQQIAQNTACLAPVLTPNFSSASNDDELAGKLKEMYEAVEKTRTSSGASYNPSVAFEFRLNAQLQKMPSDERNDFFKKAEGFSPKDEKQLNIASALEDLREKYSPAAQAESLQLPKSPTPFDTTMIKK